MSFRPRCITILVVMLFAVLPLLGCGGGSSSPPLYKVTGTVSLDGKPLEKGRIQFRIAQDNGRAFATDIVDGKYEMETEAGKMNVEITASRPVPGKMEPGPSPDEPPVPVMEMYIPKKYNSQTTLTADVEAKEENTIPFELTSK